MLQGSDCRADRTFQQNSHFYRWGGPVMKSIIVVLKEPPGGSAATLRTKVCYRHPLEAQKVFP
jgi:hypothetical protein